MKFCNCCSLTGTTSIIKKGKDDIYGDAKKSTIWTLNFQMTERHRMNKLLKMKT